MSVRKPKSSYKPGPPDISQIMTYDDGFSLIPRRPLSQGKLRFEMHKRMLVDEECHFYAGILFCFCGECKKDT